SYAVLRVSDADPQILGKLAEAGVLPDVALDVVDRTDDAVTVDIGGKRETIAAALAVAVYLRTAG
ncbi:FeoA domain-containing protein, partial [Brevibacterium epidermidis]